MNLGQGITSVAKNLGSRTLATLNSLERMFGGSGVHTASLADSVLKPNQKATEPSIEQGFSPLQNFLASILGSPTGSVIPRAQSERFVSTQQFSPQTSPQPGNISYNERTSGAVVPKVEPTKQTQQTPSQSAPFVSPSALMKTVPTPATPATERITAQPTFMAGAGFGASPAASFGAAVPQAAVLRRLAQTPGRNTPGYITTPEALPLGAAPKRRIRKEDEAPFSF